MTGGNLGGRNFLGAALLAEFLEKFFLAERIGTIQQIEQEILRVCGYFAAAVFVTVACGKGTWRDEQLRQCSGTAGKKADEIAHVVALFFSA